MVETTQTTDYRRSILLPIYFTVSSIEVGTPIQGRHSDIVLSLF
jgi:hypothetical protein